MRMSVSLDEKLLREAMAVFGTKVKREAIEIAMREAIRNRRRAEALGHCGELDLGVTSDDLERMRNEA